MVRLELQDICKQYPTVKANDRVSLRVQAGAIHAILGENGAGKSTLMKVIYGAVRPDSGVVRWNGQVVNIHSPAQARALGISMVYQHFSLFDTLTVAQNVWLGLDRHSSLSAITSRIDEVAQTYGLDVDPRRPVHTLSVGERQRVEIIRALLTHPQLLILDEPTSVLTPQAVDKLFVTLRQLAEGGCSILYISHKLDEIRALCHQCTVLRGGRVTGEVDPTQETNATLSRLMIGAEPAPIRRQPAHEATHESTHKGDVVLAVRDLSLPRQEAFGTDLQRVSFDLRAGEIVGVAGISGNGQQELMAALSGEDTRAPADCVSLWGEPVGHLSARHRRRRGLHFVPEERLGRGAVPSLSLAHNTLLTRTQPVSRRGWIDLSAARALAQRLIERFQVKAAGPEALAQSLSGGNLQKFIVGREIDAQPRVLVVAQPTWGVDVGAASQIRASLMALRDAGTAVLVVSEELEELFELCDRLVVMAKGRLSPSMDREEASMARVGQWMSGLWDQDPALQADPSRVAEGA